MSKIAIYCRVSTQMQNTDRQRVELLDRSKKLNVDILEKHIFVDVISGFTRGEFRPKYSDMMDAVDAGEIDEIWFSELTRLGRSSVELLSEIQKFQEKGVTLYFQKQDITVAPDKNDLGHNILLSVLAVCASYEIELFAERSVSGKINKVRNGGCVGGDDGSYGYTSDANKILVVRQDEADVIRWIFEQYADGKSTLEIAESLNARNIPTSLSTRAAESANRRQTKGLPPKENPHLAKSTKKWKASMISKILSKDMYRGHRHIIFHKPDVTSKGKVKASQKREIYYEYDEYSEDWRIVSDELFQRVHERLLKAPYNKNNSIKHENLLKHKLRCGECGSNFSVGKSNENTTGYLNGGRSYKCYGKINRSDKPKTCSDGGDIKQWRLDGLVITLSLQMFADIDINTTTAKQISDLSDRNSELQSLINKAKASLLDAKDTYKKQMRRLSLIADDDMANEMIQEANTDYENKKNQIEKDLERYTKELTDNVIKIKHLKTFSQKSNLYKRMDEIWRNRDVVKTMVDEFISEITLYRAHPNWLLVTIKYKNGAEMWGTLKSKKYKLSEMFFDEMVCSHGVEFHTWIINNTEQCFSYDKDNRTFKYDGQSEIYRNINAGSYTFLELNKILYDEGWIGSYPFYCYENNEYNINPPQIDDTPDFLKRLSKDNSDLEMIITENTPEWKKRFLGKKKDNSSK